jgi:hypothetical protein
VSKGKAKAWNVLGWGMDPSQQEVLSLEDELNQYYAIQAEAGLDIIAFWEVGDCYLYFIQIFILRITGS